MNKKEILSDLDDCRRHLANVMIKLQDIQRHMEEEETS